MSTKSYGTKVWPFGIVALLNLSSTAKAVNIPYEHIAGVGAGAAVFTALTYDLHHNDYVGKGVTKAIKSVPGSQHFVVRLEKFDHLHHHSKAYQTSKVVGRYLVNGLISIGTGVLTQLVFGKVKASLAPSKNNMVPIIDSNYRKALEDKIKISSQDISFLAYEYDPEVIKTFYNAISPEKIEEKAKELPLAEKSKENLPNSIMEAEEKFFGYLKGYPQLKKIYENIKASPSNFPNPFRPNTNNPTEKSIYDLYLPSTITFINHYEKKYDEEYKNASPANKDLTGDRAIFHHKIIGTFEHSSKIFEDALTHILALDLIKRRLNV